MHRHLGNPSSRKQPTTYKQSPSAGRVKFADHSPAATKTTSQRLKVQQTSRSGPASAVNRHGQTQLASSSRDSGLRGNRDSGLHSSRDSGLHGNSSNHNFNYGVFIRYLKYITVPANTVTCLRRLYFVTTCCRRVGSGRKHGQHCHKHH